MSLTESAQAPSVALNDKFLHAAFYTVLALAWLLPLTITNHQSPITNYAVVLLGTTAFGGLMELLQHFCTLTRSSEWLDLLADFVGAFIGILLVLLWRRLSTISH